MQRSRPFAHVNVCMFGRLSTVQPGGATKVAAPSSRGCCAAADAALSRSKARVVSTGFDLMAARVRGSRYSQSRALVAQNGWTWVGARSVTRATLPATQCLEGFLQPA